MLEEKFKQMLAEKLEKETADKIDRVDLHLTESGGLVYLYCNSEPKKIEKEKIVDATEFLLTVNVFDISGSVKKNGYIRFMFEYQ